MLGSDSATAIAPIEETGCLSKSAVQFPPPSVDFHTPPAAPPKKYVFGSPGMPVTASDRPPRNGPTSRHFIPLNNVSGTVCAAATAATNSTTVMNDLRRNGKVQLLFAPASISKATGREETAERQRLFQEAVKKSRATRLAAGRRHLLRCASSTMSPHRLVGAPRI